MTDANDPATPRDKARVEALELRARPAPVTRINRRVLIGGAAVVMILISGLVLLALKPPAFHGAKPEELIDVEHKPLTDRLAKLPATYEDAGPQKRSDETKRPDRVPQLIAPDLTDPLNNAARVEKARLDRMAGQARESQVFFRLQLKSPPTREAPSANDARSEQMVRPVASVAPANTAMNSALRASERAVRSIRTTSDRLERMQRSRRASSRFLKPGRRKTFTIRTSLKRRHQAIS